MIDYPALRIAAVVVDAFIVAALTHELVLGRVPRRWRIALVSMTVVVTFLFVDALVYVAVSPNKLELPLGTLNAFAAFSIAAFALVLRRSILRPQRLLRRVDLQHVAASNDVDNIPAIVVSLTRDGEIRRVNQRGKEMLGCGDEVAGKDFFSVFTERETQDIARESFLAFVATGGRAHSMAEYRIYAPTGERLVRWRRSAQFDSDGEVMGVVSYGEDVTEKRQLEQTMRAESYLLDAVHDAVTVVDTDGELLYLNRAAYELFGYTREEFVALGQYGWVAPESTSEAVRQNEEVLRRGDVLYELVGLTKSSERMHLEIRSQLVNFNEARAVMNICRDVSSRKQAQELMLQMALNDPLTGLPNRRTVQDRLTVGLSRVRRQGNSLSVLYLDVDNVKNINDNLGHDAGDALITIVAKRLKTALREGDTVGRVGGDEFVILLPDITHPAQSQVIAERILMLLQEPMTINGHEIRMTASVGLLDCEGDTNADEALTRADRAMYAAKRAGGNRVIVHTPSLDEAVSDRLSLKTDVAVACEHNELVLNFQPIVRGVDYRLTGIEALARWKHPIRGLLGPTHFIPLAEETGHIKEIGRWVIGEACSTLIDLRRQGLEVERIAVNVSPMQLMESRFVDEVMNTLAQLGCEPSSLELEITETGAMANMDRIQQSFKELHDYGVRLALDDFGTGHSSLERLRRLPFTTLKIDKTFVSDLCSSPGHHPIIDTIIVLASNLGLNAVAEGVETQCHLEYLRDVGCAEMQGYVFSQPVDAPGVLRLGKSGYVGVDETSRKSCRSRNSCLVFSKSEQTLAAAE